MNLSELIYTAKADRSYSDLERDSNRTPLASRWHQLATMPLKNFPDPPTIKGLALGLRVSEWQVIRSAAESLGFKPATESKLGILLPPGVEDLDDDQIAAILAVIMSMVRRVPPKHRASDGANLGNNSA
jgi:hypothetical protein